MAYLFEGGVCMFLPSPLRPSTFKKKPATDKSFGVPYYCDCTQMKGLVVLHCIYLCCIVDNLRSSVGAIRPKSRVFFCNKSVRPNSFNGSARSM